MKEFFQEHKVLKIFVLFFMFVVMHLAWRFLIGAQGHAYLGSNQNYFWGQVIGTGIPALIVAALAGTLGCLKWNGKNMLRSLLSGMLLLLLMGLLFVSNIGDTIRNQAELKGIGDIVWYVLLAWMIGFSEELFCRGVLLESFLRIFGNTRGGIWKSVLLSAFMFGMMHLTTMLRGHSLQGTLLQICSATVIGALFGSIYARHRSLYGCAFLHAFNDLATLFNYGVYKGRSLDETYVSESSGASWDVLLALIPFVIAILIIMRKKKLLEVIEREKSMEET